MATRTHSYSSIYNTLEKVESFWDALKPDSEGGSDYKDKWLALASLFDTISLQNRVCITLWDVVSNQFIYVADETKVLGKNGPYLLQKDGIDFTMSCILPEYLQANLLAHGTSIQYCVNHSQYLPNRIVINCDYAYQKKDEEDIHLLQQAMPVEVDNHKHPILFLSYIYDISHLKKQCSSNLVIKSPEEILMWNYDFEKKTLNPSKEITEKEYNILQLLAEGKNTKQIAATLYISPHTVDTHRRNLLGKTNCIDSTALVTYSRMVGLL